MSTQPDYLRQVVGALPQALWLRDAKTGVFLYCSPGAGAVWQVSSQRLMQHPQDWLGAIVPEDRIRVETAWNRCATEGHFDQQYRVRHRDGAIRWIRDRGSALSGHDGNSTQVAGLAHDMTMRKRLESEVTKAYDALHSSVNGVIITNLDGRIAYANPAFLGLFGYTDLSSALGERAENLFVREDIEELREVADEIADSGNRTREFIVRRKDGSAVTVETSSSEVHDGQGDVIGTMASFFDVTERKRREAEVQQHHRQLVRLTERMADLEEQERRRISSLIHDTVVQSLSLANIRLGAVSKALAESELEREKTQLETGREMIAEGISQCRLVMGDLTPPLLYEVGLGAALKQFANRIQRLQGISVEVEEITSIPVVPESLRGLLFQAARELVMNACKHAAPSAIRVRLTSSDREVQLSVRDDGAGFDPKLIERRQQETAGGFGLFSVRQRLNRHGGTLSVESQPGTGSELHIRLPLP